MPCVLTRFWLPLKLMLGLFLRAAWYWTIKCIFFLLATSMGDIWCNALTEKKVNYETYKYRNSYLTAWGFCPTAFDLLPAVLDIVFDLVPAVLDIVFDLAPVVLDIVFDLAPGVCVPPSTFRVPYCMNRNIMSKMILETNRIQIASSTWSSKGNKSPAHLALALITSTTWKQTLPYNLQKKQTLVSNKHLVGSWCRSLKQIILDCIYSKGNGVNLSVKVVYLALDKFIIR